MAASEPKRLGVSIELKPHAYDPVANPELFDGVPLERMPEAERLVREAADAMPDDLRARLEGVGALTDGDRETIVGLARRVLAGLPSRPASGPLR